MQISSYISCCFCICVYFLHITMGFIIIKWATNWLPLFNFPYIKQFPQKQTQILALERVAWMGYSWRCHCENMLKCCEYQAKFWCVLFCFITFFLKCIVLNRNSKDIWLHGDHDIVYVSFWKDLYPSTTHEINHHGVFMLTPLFQVANTHSMPKKGSSKIRVLHPCFLSLHVSLQALESPSSERQ